MSRVFTDADVEWAVAFDFWHSTTITEPIAECLRANIPLSPSNARFLAALIAGEIKPATGKQALSQYRVKQESLDRLLFSWKDASVTRERMLDRLIEQKLVPDTYSLGAVNKRFERAKQRGSAFAAIYEQVTGEPLPLSASQT